MRIVTLTCLLFFAINNEAYAQLSQLNAMKKAIKNGPDACGIYCSFGDYNRSWLEQHNYTMIYSKPAYPQTRMSYIEFMKKRDVKNFWETTTSLGQIGSFKIPSVIIKEKDLKSHFDNAMVLINAPSFSTLKHIRDDYIKLRKRYPKWYMVHLMIANLERRIDPIIMGGQNSAKLGVSFMYYRFSGLNLINAFENIDFTNISSEEELNEKAMQFYVNTEIVYYMYSLVKYKKAISKDEAFVKLYLTYLNEIENQIITLSGNSFQPLNKTARNQWLVYFKEMHEVMKEDNSIMAGLIIAGFIYLEGGKYILKKVAESGALDGSSSTSTISANSPSNIKYNSGNWEKKGMLSSVVHDSEYMKVSFECKGLQWTEYIGRDLSQSKPYSAGTNVCEFAGSKRFNLLDEAVQHTIDCRCN